MIAEGNRYCAHCGAPRSPTGRNCASCGSSVQLENVTDRPAICHECAGALAESWRFCPRCGGATPIANLSRSTRTFVAESDNGDAGRSAQAAGPSPPLPKHAEELPASAFCGLAARHARHRLRQGQGIEGEIVEDDPQPAEPAVELISRTRKPDPAPLVPPPIPSAVTSSVAPPPPVVTQPATTPAIDVEPAPATQPTGRATDARRKDPPPPRIEAEGQTIRLEAPEFDGQVFRDPEPIGQVAQLALLILGMVATVAIVSLIVLNNRIADIGQGAADGYDNAAGVESFINSWVRPALFGVTIGTFLLLVAWTFVVYRNLLAAGREGLRVGPWAAAWSWFVPGVNLFLPKRLIDDAWRGAAPDAWRDQDWKLRPGATWTTVFWVALMAAIALTFVGWRVGGATVETALDANGWAILGLGAAVVATLAGVRMITVINARQLELADGAS